MVMLPLFTNWACAIEKQKTLMQIAITRIIENDLNLPISMHDCFNKQ